MNELKEHDKKSIGVEGSGDRALMDAVRGLGEGFAERKEVGEACGLID
jgi:hypothetical protein